MQCARYFIIDIFFLSVMLKNHHGDAALLYQEHALRINYNGTREDAGSRILPDIKGVKNMMAGV